MWTFVAGVLIVSVVGYLLRLTFVKIAEKLWM